MNFNQRVSGAFHGAALAGRAQQPAHQRGLAGAEIAFQPDRQAGTQVRGQGGPQGKGIGFGGQG